jgi:hypothetical protein
MGESEKKPNWPLRTGILLVALTYFTFAFYQFTKAIFNIEKRNFWFILTDESGAVGLAFRSVAGLIAVLAILFFIAKKDLSKPEVLMTLRWVLIGEAVCFLALFPVVPWAFTGPFNINGFVASTLPVLIESIVIPAVLIKLFFELNPNKPAKGAIKWGLIAGTVYIFVFWLDNAGNWLVTAARGTEFFPGFQYVTAYPDHILSFGLTTVGLLVLALYAAYFTKKSIGTETLEKLDLRKAGLIITALGMYFLLVYVLWLMFGTDMQFAQSYNQILDVKWSNWYAWLLGHNVELWFLSLPLVGLPLLFSKRASKQENA